MIAGVSILMSQPTDQEGALLKPEKARTEPPSHDPDQDARQASAPPASRLARLFRPLFSPVDNATLVFFRIGFGLVLLWECFRYASKGWIAKYWLNTEYLFPYPFFEWLTPWPGYGMYIHFAVMAVLAIFVVIGLFYRVSALLLFLAFTYVFLLDEARYLNHFYLVALLSFCMIFVPCHRRLSMDARQFPQTRSQTAPRWSLILLRFMVGLPYFFGGIAKINPDWLRCEPMRTWLAARADKVWFGGLFEFEPTVWFFSYGGLLLDLSAVPLLLWSRTRPFVMMFILFFHFTNSSLFSIGIFPWFMVLATLIFFPPDWPGKLIRDIAIERTRRGMLCVAVGVATGYLALECRGEPAIIPFVGGALAGALLYWTLAERLQRRAPGMSFASALWHPAEVSARAPAESPAESPAPLAGRLTGRQWLIAGLLALWMAMHVLLPLRHFLIPGDVNWTEEGHRFAWHMKLRDKSVRIKLYAVDPATGKRHKVKHRNYLTKRQSSRMAKRPYMIRQFAHYLAKVYEKKGMKGVEIYAKIKVSLNGRPLQYIVDPEVDLAKQPISYWKADWIKPLAHPLP